MARTLKVPKVGIGGRRTDSPTWNLRPDELADGSQDGIVWEGAVRRRRGVSSQSIAFGDAHAVIKYSSFLTGRKGGIAVSSDTTSSPFYTGISFQDTPSTIRVAPNNERSLSPLLPRASYNDEILWCFQNGLGPVYRTNQADTSVAISSTGAGTTTAGQAIATWAGGLEATRGCYVLIAPFNGSIQTAPNLWVRVLETSGTTVTLENIRCSTTQTLSASSNDISFIGLAYPCIETYSAGTVTTTATTATGTGTAWTSQYHVFDNGSLIIYNGPKGLLAKGQTTYQMGIASGYPASDTSLSVDGAVYTNTAYGLISRPTFKDVCVHNNTLYGVGVYQYPNRVYVAPPGWDMTLPPGATTPYDPSVVFTSGSRSDFLLDFIDVPNPVDSDAVVAILSTDGPRLVLKTKSVHGVYGDPPSLTQREMNVGDGCIDIRSAISVTEGAFWAGRDGIYRYRYGQMKELTEGWMRNEWRALVNSGIDYCATGVDGRHLVVSIKTADAKQEKRTYLYDLELERWMPEITNIYPRHMFTANITGEIQQLLCVDDAHSGKILNLSPALNNTGPSRDEVGTGPNFKVVTGDSLIGGGSDTEGEARVLEAQVHANVNDPGGTTTISVQATHGGSLRGDGSGLYGGFLYGSGTYYGPDGGKALGTITGDNDADLDRHPFAVNRTGRRMGVVIEETTTSSTVLDVEVGELVVNMRDTRKGT